MVDLGPEAVEKKLYHPAGVRPHTKRLQCGALSGAGSRRLLPSKMAKVWKKHPNPPNRGVDNARREVEPIFQDVESHAVSKATPCSLPEEIGELRRVA